MNEEDEFEKNNPGIFMKHPIDNFPECSNDEDAAANGVAVGEWYQLKDTYYDKYGNQSLKGMLKQRLQ